MSTPQGQTLWQLQIEMGRVIGPLTTEQLLFRIREGLVSGSEKIRRYPEGPWMVVSREPIFYDELLSALEKTQARNPAKSAGGLGQFTKTRPPNDDEDATVIRPAGLTPNNSFPENLRKSVPPSKELDFAQLQERENQLKKAGGGLEDEYMQSSKIGSQVSQAGSAYKSLPPEHEFVPERRAKRTKNPLHFLLFVIAAAGLVIYGLYWQSKSSSSELTFGLMGPKKINKVKLPVADQKKMLELIFESIYADTPEDYFKAQVLSTRLIEGAPSLSDARALLCIAHYHLWPYVNQNSVDFDTVQSARRAARSLDPRGMDGLHCEVSYLMILGKYKDALGIIEHAASDKDLPESPVLYSLKAETLAAEKKYADAIIWATEAQKLWPRWIYPFYQTAQFEVETAQYEKAEEILQNILKANPRHKATLIELGSLQSMQLQQPEVGEATLLKAVSIESRVLKSQEAKAYFILAQRMLDKRKADKALKYAERAFQLNSSDLKIRDFLIQLGGNPNAIIANRKANEMVFMGDQYFRSGDYLFAQAQYKTAFEQDPTNALAASKAARCLWMLSQSQEAIAWTRKAIKADPKLSLPYFQAADYLSQQYNFPLAVEILNQGIQKLPNNPEILRGFGLVELRRSNPRDAIAYLERSAKQFDSDEETLILLARAYLQSGSGDDLQKALNRATQAIQLEDTNPEGQVLYAKILAQQKGVDAGVDYMKGLVAKYAYTPEFRMGLAEIYRSADRYGAAQTEYERLLLMDSNNKKSLMGIAECFQASGQLDKALKKYLSAAVLDPSDPEPLFKGGMVYLEAGRYKDAIAQFQRTLAVSPSFPKVNYFIGRAFLEMKDGKAALAAVEAEKRINPQLSDPYILAGEIYLEGKDYAKCSAEYQQAIRFKPIGADNYVKLALCQELSGNLEVAESMLAIALSQESGYAEIYKVQGNISERKGDRAAAVQAYQKYLLLAPNAADSKEIELRLGELSR
jgi:tetratricopeptide (TPR) repeat protein